MFNARGALSVSASLRQHQIQTNTTKAHELLHLAKTLGKQVELKERLMAAHFEEARQVGRIEDPVGTLANHFVY